jgi:ribose/xylose/arabinose/galactoside ABC-type transport system permease subunit
VAAVVAITAHIVLSRTVFGRWLYAIGLNARAAEVSGVPVRRAVLWAFVISGALAGVSSILYTGRLETGTPVLGQRILLDIVGSAVIGGVSLFGGKGRITWTLYGVLFLTVVDKGLQLLGLPIASVFAIKGGVILLAAVIDALRHRLLLRA